MEDISNGRVRPEDATFCLTVNDPGSNIYVRARDQRDSGAPLRAGLDLARNLGEVLEEDSASVLVRRLHHLSTWTDDQTAVRLELAFFLPEPSLPESMHARLSISMYLPGHMPEDRWDPALITDEQTKWAAMAVHGIANGRCGREIVGAETVIWAVLSFDRASDD